MSIVHTKGSCNMLYDVGKPSNFRDQFTKITKRYKQDEHLATVCTSGVSPITVYSYDHAFLFNCTTVSQASDSMKARRKTFIRVLVPDACL